jgi:hypothetical protein
MLKECLKGGSVMTGSLHYLFIVIVSFCYSFGFQRPRHLPGALLDSSAAESNSVRRGTDINLTENLNSIFHTLSTGYTLPRHVFFRTTQQSCACVQRQQPQLTKSDSNNTHNEFPLITVAIINIFIRGKIKNESRFYSFTIQSSAFSSWRDWDPKLCWRNGTTQARRVKDYESDNI